MLKESVIELLIFNIVVLTIFIYPYLYISLKKGKNKFLFFSACIGAIFIIVSAIYAFCLPFAILLVKVIPQLAEYQQLDNVLPLLHLADFLQTYFFIVFVPLLMLALPVLIHRRYEIFK